MSSDKRAGLSRSACTLLFAALLFAACDDDNGKDPIDYANIDIIDYSEHVQPLLNQRCATSGCHNSAAKTAGLSLSSWNDAIEGSLNGEVVIAFKADQSLMVSLFDIVSKRAEHPAVDANRMFTDVELNFIKRWINEGAKNDAGQVPFTGNTDRVYVTNQLSDLVSIIDIENNVVARIAEVGSVPSSETAHFVVADDQYYYVTLINADEVWKMDITTDSMVAKTTIAGAPALMAITPDGNKLYVSQFMGGSPTDFIEVIETSTMSIINTIEIAPAPATQIPHGIRINNAGTRVYVASLAGNYISVIDAQTDSVIAGRSMPGCAPLQVSLTPDDSELWVSCTAYDNDTLHVLDAVTLADISQIPVGNSPWHTAFTPDGSLCFVPNRIGNSIMVVDVASRTVIETITDPAITLPHGCGVSSDGNYAYISNGNPDGDFIPRFDAANIGNVVVINTSTLQIEKVLELELLPTGLYVYP